MEHPHSILDCLVHLLTAVLPVQLPASMPDRAAEDGPRSQIPDIHRRDPDGRMPPDWRLAPPWLFAGHLGSEPLDPTWVSLCVFLFAFPINSFKKTSAALKVYHLPFSVTLFILWYRPHLTASTVQVWWFLFVLGLFSRHSGIWHMLSIHWTKRLMSNSWRRHKEKNKDQVQILHRTIKLFLWLLPKSYKNSLCFSKHRRFFLLWFIFFFPQITYSFLKSRTNSLTKFSLNHVSSLYFHNKTHRHKN